MVAKLAESIVDTLEKEKIITAQLREHYIYACITLIERIVTILSLLCISIGMGNVVISFIFLEFFKLLRSRTGGYHAKNFSQCYLLSLIICIAVVCICSRLQGQCIYKGICIMFFMAFFVIFIIGTVNHPNVCFDESELRILKRWTRIILIVETSVIIGGSVLGDMNRKYIMAMMLAIILCAVLMVLAKIIGQEVNRGE